MPMSPLFTIGHSNRSAEEFLGLLQRHHITLLIDVRKLAGSRSFPHFNADVLADHLSRHDIGYRHMEALTGRRPVNRDIPDEVNGWWSNRSFHNYADHAITDGFREALEELRGLAAAHRPAVMCSEAVWWRCHRRIIADHLLAAGDEVVHIMGPGDPVAAELSGGAVVRDGRLTYPASGPAGAQ